MLFRSIMTVKTIDGHDNPINVDDDQGENIFHSEKLVMLQDRKSVV